MELSKSRFRVFFNNWLSVAGIIILCFAFVVGTALLLVDITSGFHSPYAGLIVYMGMPVMAMGGLFLVLLGAVVTIIKRHKTGHDAPLPSVDLNDSKVLRRFIVFCVAMMMLLAVSGLGAYHAYHYTESVEFCGEVCHEVMEPEYVAYQNSPHSNISCAHCHIGPGAEWFVKAKLSGLYQVYSVMFDKYSRPIHTPVHNLRPAKETCNECHRPQKSFGAVLRNWTYYLPNKENSPWTIRMLLKVGGGDPKHAPVKGIHWHMNEENKIEYVSVEDKRMEIPWIRVTDKDGKETIYQVEGEELSDEELHTMEEREMDCIDCHNRPTHQISSPNKALDKAMMLGLVDKTVPNIKVNAVDLLTGKYEDKEQALAAIDKGLREEYPDQNGIDALVAAIQDIYVKNFFPKMKADWRVYPDHIGHKITAGCFRCHDDRHVSSDGKKLTRDCNLCHIIIAQGPGEVEDLESVTTKGLEFQHPEDIDGEWKTENCSGCHEGTPM